MIIQTDPTINIGIENIKPSCKAAKYLLLDNLLDIGINVLSNKCVNLSINSPPISI